tara:strand:+ start:2452 stop:3066 length:615 start_codon:yes stop_codon:yes gene_type:complete
MGWFEILKLESLEILKGDSGGQPWLYVNVKSEQAAVDLFALIVKNRLEGKDWDASPPVSALGLLVSKYKFDEIAASGSMITNFDPHNPQEIINEAKKLKYVIDFDGYERDKKYINGLDLNKHLQYFITVMKTHGYNMEEFKKVKGLLSQEANSGGGDVDLTPKIKQVIQMFKHMNKPITQESVMEELDLDEKSWKDEYDKLLLN